MPKNIPKWPLRETINQYELAPLNSSTVFFRTNKAVIFGKAETDLTRHHAVKTEVFYSVTLGVERSDSYVDHIPVIISDTLIKKENLSKNIAGTWLEVAGQLRSYNIIVDGFLQHPLLVFARAISVFPNACLIENQNPTSKNVIFLAGYVAEYPICHSVCGNKDITSIILAVSGHPGNVYLLPCIMTGYYARFATYLKAGDFITLYGQLQNKVRSPYQTQSCLMYDYNTEYEVFVVDIQSAPSFRHYVD